MSKIRNTITIPATREEMVTTLTGWQTLITATQWSKAATLAAYVELPGQGHRSDLAKNSQVLSPREFAKLGIAGLRSKDTITKYVRRWIASGRPIPQPGDEVDLDGLPEWDTGVEEAAPNTAEVVPAPPTKEPAPKRRKWDDLTPEEQAADNAMAEEGGRNLVRITKERMAAEDAAMQGQAEGARMAQLRRIGAYLASVDIAHLDSFQLDLGTKGASQVPIARRTEPGQRKVVDTVPRIVERKIGDQVVVDHSWVGTTGARCLRVGCEDPKNKAAHL